METTLLPSYNELCLSAKALQKNIHLHLAQLAQLILSLGSLALLIIAIWTYKRNKLVLHFNFILIMTNIIILYALNSIALIAEPLRYQVRRYEKEGSKYALLCTIIIWILSVTYISCMVILAWNDVTFQSPAIFSTLTNDRNSTYLISSHTFCLMVVIITAITDYFLLYTNRKNRSK
ncbi:hypothetical protein DdX_13093 [Ditylenchus destructor]|uniref:Uncharacterized protein n=1 Tax=Ditylenchus destructor TaxID=166010 RepID=A0AAD4MX92_9BILA|nr:hypothetical protein DdX_13093 [Ditylenchus destructor]